MTLLHQRAGNAARWLFTRWVFGLWAVYYLLHPFERLAALPRGYYAPVGVLGWLPPSLEGWLWAPGVLPAIRLLLIAACAGAMVGRTFRPAAIVCCLLITVEQSFVRGFSSFMNHAEVPALLAVYLLTAFAWIDRWPDRWPGTQESDAATGGFHRDGRPLFAFAAVLCATYAMVGVSRLVHGGAAIFGGDLMVGGILFYAPQPWFVDLDWGPWLLEWRHARTALNAGLAAVTALEVLAPLCLVSRRFRTVFVPAIALFHLAVLVTMRIEFFENLLLLPVLLDFGRRLPAADGAQSGDGAGTGSSSPASGAASA